MDKPNTINAIPGQINLLKHQKPLTQPAAFAAPTRKLLSMPDSLEHTLMRVITLRLFLPAVIFAFLLMGLSVYLYARMVDREQVQIAQSIATLTDEYLEHASQSLNTVAFIAENNQLYAISAFVQAEQKNHTYFHSISLLDNNGNPLYGAPISGSQAAVGNNTIQLFDNSPQKGEVQVSNPFVSPETGLLTIMLSRSLAGGGSVVGELNLSSLQKTIFDALPSSRQGQVFFLSDANGTLMADSISQMDAQQASLSFFRPRKMISTGSQSRLVFNQSQLAIESEKQLENANWVVSAEIPLQKAFTPYLWAAWITLTFLLLLWAVLILSIPYRDQTNFCSIGGIERISPSSL